MQKDDKERIVAELTERLRNTESLIVADYRGLRNSDLQELRSKLREHGARFSVVKNTLSRRAAEAAGAETLLALLEGPTAIAFVEADGDPIAVAKALSDTAQATKVMSLRGGVLQGSPMSEAEVQRLAKLPPEDVLRSQLVGVIVAPLTQLLGLLSAPLRDLVGLIDARISQLEEGAGADSADADAIEPSAQEAPAAKTPEAPQDAVRDETSADQTSAAETDAAETDAETGAETAAAETSEDNS
jgi:large subunit ribosomal protein L10